LPAHPTAPSIPIRDISFPGRIINDNFPSELSKRCKSQPQKKPVGSYTVASENLGAKAGLLAAAALMIDYILTAILVPALIITMSAVKRHYDRVARQIAVDCPMRVENLAEPLVIVPLDRWTRITEKGLRFALKISNQVQAVHVDAEECSDEVQQMWKQNVATPLRESGKTVPELVLLSSPYRFVLAPLVEYILRIERDHPDRQIAVLVPELVVKHWWHAPLHNQRAQLLKVLLLVRGNQRIMVINIPWYL
jgi:hypothetical protein